MKLRRTSVITDFNQPPTFTRPGQGTPHLTVYFHAQLSTQPFVSRSDKEQIGTSLREIEMMTGRRACDIWRGPQRMPDHIWILSTFPRPALLILCADTYESHFLSFESFQHSGTASRPLVFGERPGRAPSPQPPTPRTTSATSLPPQRQQRSRSDRPVAADGEMRQPGTRTRTGMGFVSRWHRRLPSHRSHSTPAPPPSSSRRKSAALSREGVQPTKGQAQPAIESPRLPVPASPRSSSPGPGGSEGGGPGWSPQPRAAPCDALLRGASAAGGWRLCGLARAARSVPGGGARRHRGRRRIPQVLPLLLAPSSLSPPGLSSLVAFWAPLPSTRGVSGSTRFQKQAHVLRSLTCSLHAWV